MILIEHKEFPFYHIELKNIFTEPELKKITQKILSLKSDFKSPEDTMSAFNGKEFLKKNKGTFLNENNDIIADSINNVLKNVYQQPGWKNFCFKRIFDNLEWGGDLIQSYENSDYYKPHCDIGIFTLIIWIYDGEKNVNGGDLYFPEHNYLHLCKNNNGIIFFSRELHGVTTLKSNSNSTRYSITTFSSLNEKKNDGHRTFLKNKFSYN